jgi:lysophospholipase L1-like esterase
MSARGRFLSVLVSIVAALAGFVTIGALPAAADSPAVQYVALGDSYAAGQGALPYLNSCLQSTKGYPALLDSEKHIHLQANETCTGAETSEVADTLSALNRGTRLVTLTVGAANLDVSGVAAACTTGTLEECQMKIAAARALLPAELGGPSVLGDLLTSLFAEVVDAAPRARVVVTGYPLLFAPAAPGTQNADIINAVNAATVLLNDAIKQAVIATQAPNVDIRYVDVTVPFGGHGIGGPLTPFINPPGAGSPDAFHPTAPGYVAYAAAISAELPAEWLDKQAQLA